MLTLQQYSDLVAKKQYRKIFRETMKNVVHDFIFGIADNFPLTPSGGVTIARRFGGQRTIRAELLRATFQCTERLLTNDADWLGLLNSLAELCTPTDQWLRFDEPRVGALRHGVLRVLRNPEFRLLVTHAGQLTEAEALPRFDVLVDTARAVFTNNLRFIRGQAICAPVFEALKSGFYEQHGSSIVKRVEKLGKELKPALIAGSTEQGEEE